MRPRCRGPGVAVCGRVLFATIAALSIAVALCLPLSLHDGDDGSAPFRSLVDEDADDGAGAGSGSGAGVDELLRDLSERHLQGLWEANDFDGHRRDLRFGRRVIGALFVRTVFAVDVFEREGVGAKAMRSSIAAVIGIDVARLVGGADDADESSAFEAAR